MDIGRAVGGPFRDPRWFGKIALGALMMMVPFVNLAVGGFGLEYIRKVSRGDDNLPEWSGFGTYWVRGLCAGFAGFVYMLPALAIAFAGVLPPLMAAGTRSVAQGDPSALLAALGGTLTFLLLAFVYILAVSVIMQGAFVHYALTGEFGSLFAFSAIWQKVSSGSGYFVAWIAAWLIRILSYAVAGAIGFLLGMIPCVGQVLAFPAGLLVGMVAKMMCQHGYGQYAASAYGTAPAAAWSPGYTPAGPTAPLPTVPPTAFAPAGAPRASSAPAAPAFRPSMPSVPGGARASAAPAAPPTMVAPQVAAAPDAAPAVVPLVPVVSAPDGGTIVAPRPFAPEEAALDEAAPDETALTAAEAEPELDVEIEAVAATEPESSVAAGVAEACEPLSAEVKEPERAPDPKPAFTPASPPVTASPRSATVIERPGMAVSAGRLYVVKGEGVGQSWRLPHADIKIGRDAQCGIMLSDGKVSREHSKVQYRDGAYRILDMGSSNGTHVNEEKVLGTRVLADKDRVRVGDTVFEFREE